jgi:hypothetical protein
MGRLCYPTQFRPTNYPSILAEDSIRPEKEGMAHFLPSWYNFYYVLARSRYKFDRSRQFIPGYKASSGHWRSVAVQAVSEPEIYHGAEFQLRADERVRVQEPLQICLGCRNKSKKCDNTTYPYCPCYGFVLS